MAECGSVILASFVAQVRGVMFYGLQVHGARLAERVVLVRRPDNPYDNNYLDVRVAYRSCWVSSGGGSCAPLSFAFKGSHALCHIFRP